MTGVAETLKALFKMDRVRSGTDLAGESDRDMEILSDTIPHTDANDASGHHSSATSAPSLPRKPHQIPADGSIHPLRSKRLSETSEGDGMILVDRLRKKLQSTKNDDKNLARDAEAAYAECVKLGKQLRITKRNIQSLQSCLDDQEINSDTRISELENRTVALQLALEDAQREKQKLQNDVRVAQEGALQSMEKENHTCMEDREVREQLSKMNDKFIGWAKKHSIDDVSALDSVPETELNIIIQSLHEYCIQEKWPQFQTKLPSLFRKMPLLLVQASISNNILRLMFTNPFFLFPVGPDYTSCPSPSQMAKLYGMIKNGKEADGHIWRSQTLQALRNARTDTSSGTGSVIPRLRDAFGLELAMEFLASPVGVLLRPLDSEVDKVSRVEGLAKLIHGAADLAFSLWMQRTTIACYGLCNMRVFSSKKLFITPHRLHHLDDDDESLDGHRVILVTQPLIVAWGDENAENYDMHKIWANGTVCVEE